MTSSQDILTLTLSNNKSYHFDVVVDDRNPQDKLLLMITVTYDTDVTWTVSMYEDDISVMSSFVAETLMSPDKAQTSDVQSVASLLYSIVIYSKERKNETSS